MHNMNRKFPLSISRLSKGYLLVALLCASPSALALKLEAVVSSNNVSINEAFQLVIEADESLSRSDLDIQGLSQDFIYAAPSISSSTSIINGEKSQSTTWRINLAARKAGTFIIPSFEINGAKTQPISITVSDASTNDSQDKNNDSVRLEVSVDANDGYIGENFLYTVKLLIGIQTNDLTLDPPYGQGLSIEQFGEDRQTEAVLNGKRYHIIHRQYQVTPTKGGSLTINSPVLKGSTISGNAWGPRVGIPFEREGDNLTLDIKAKPDNYQGFWLPTSDLQLSQRWSPDNLSNDLTAKVGEPINRELVLKVKNINQSLMPNIEVTYPDSVKVYADKPLYSTDGEYTVMTIKQAIIPRQQGTVNLPPISLSWFNTTTEQEEISEVLGLTINVETGSNAPLTESNAATIMPPNVKMSTNENVATISQSGVWPWLTALFATLWLITLGLYWRKISPQNLPTMILPKKGTSAWDALKHAVLNRDTIKVASSMKDCDFSNIAADTAAEIQEKINEMMTKQYSNTQDGGLSDWSNETLINLINRAILEEKSHDRTKSTLRDLQP